MEEGDRKRPPIPSPSSTWAGQDGLGCTQGFASANPTPTSRRTSPQPSLSREPGCICCLPFLGPWNLLSALPAGTSGALPVSPRTPHWHPHCRDGETGPDVPTLPKSSPSLAGRLGV